MTRAFQEGLLEFVVPGVAKPCHTWYKIVGNLNTEKIPVILLHGGPGACHDYLLPMADLSPLIPCIFYDQVGNGRSTRLPEKAGDEEFWTTDLFIHELNNLITGLGLRKRPIDVYGHSWGGMLAVEWAARPCASNLRRLVISNSLASMDVWRICTDTLKRNLPEDAQKAIDRAVESKNFDSPEYEAAMELFCKRHLSLSRPYPAQEVKDALYWIAKDSTSYSTMYGPSDFYISGSLRNWTCIPVLNNIKVPTLLINGTEDQAQDEAMQPFFDGIQKVKWITLDNAAHLSYVDQKENYFKHLRGFLQS